MAEVTYSSGVGDVQGRVTDNAVPNQPITREEAAGTDWGDQDLSGFRKDPLHGYIAQDRCHSFLQRLDHLAGQSTNPRGLSNGRGEGVVNECAGMCCEHGHA